MSRPVVYLAAGTLLTLLLQTAAAALGPAAVLVGLVVPLPAAFAHLRCGALTGGGIVLLTTAVLYASGGPGPAAWYFLTFGLGSFVLPALLRRGWQWDRAAALTLAVVLGTGALVVGGMVQSRGVPLGEAVRQVVQAEIDQALVFYQEANLPEEQVEELRAVAPGLARVLILTWPALVAVSAAFVTLLQVAILARLAPGRYSWPGPAFHLWKTPEHLIWLLIGAGFGILLGEGSVEAASINLLAVLLPVYFLQGLAVVTFYFRKKGISPFFRTMGYAVAVLLNPFPLIVTGIGLFDLWADFRKPKIKK